jgi:hypothetical protein
VATCPNGHENPEDQAFCGSCGTRIAARQQDEDAGTDPDGTQDGPAGYSDSAARTLSGSPVDGGVDRPPSDDVHADRPHVGGWGWAIFFFGWIGGLVGYLSLRPRDPRRANHVLKWGFITSVASIALWIATLAALVAAFSSQVHTSSVSNSSNGLSSGTSANAPPSVPGTCLGNFPCAASGHTVFLIVSSGSEAVFTDLTQRVLGFTVIGTGNVEPPGATTHSIACKPGLEDLQQRVIQAQWWQFNQGAIRPHSAPYPAVPPGGSDSADCIFDESGSTSSGSSTPSATYPMLGDEAVRSTPSVNGTTVGSVSKGQQVVIACTANGDSVSDPFNAGVTSTLWDRLADPSGYVADVWVRTLTHTAVAPPCT